MASYLFRCFLLQLLFGAVHTGTVMFALSGMCFPLFSNLTFHELMALYRNGNEDYVMIARWENATFTSKDLNPNYTGKVFLEINKTLVIRMCNLDHHSAKYLVQYGINTAGPEVELTIMENKQLDVCLNSPPNSPEKCFGNLTEEQVVQYIEKFLDDHPQYIKRDIGKLTEDEIEKWLDDHPGFMKKYFGNLTGEQIGQIRKLLDDQTEDIKEYLNSWNPIFLGQLIVTCIIGMMTLLCILRNQIREGLINMKDWIQKKLCCQPMSGNGSQSQVTSFGMEESELSKEDQVHKWLNDHPDFMDKYLGKLTGDQICKQIQKWQDAYRGLFENKYLDAHENDQVVPPTLDELSVTLTQHSGTGIDGNPNQSVSTQEIFNASQHSGEDVNNYQAVILTLVEPPVTLTETGNEIEGNQMQMSARKTFIESQSSDELVKYDTATKPTLNELGVTLCGPGSGTEGNQGQLELSQEDVISTCSSRSSVTCSEPSHSGTQPFNNNEQDANPEQGTAQDVVVLIEDSDSEDKCKVPLLEGSC